MLHIDVIQKSIKGRAILCGASLDLHFGEVHAVVGESGAGKTTLLRIIAGELYPDSGSISRFGDVWKVTQPRFVLEHGIHLVPQPFDIERNATLGAFIARALPPPDRGDDRKPIEHAKEFIARFAPEGWDATTSMREFTRSRQQLALVLRALAAKPNVLLLDHPTDHLTLEDRVSFLECLEQLRKRDVAICLVNPFLEEVMEMADRYTVLCDGSAVAHGLIRNTTIEELAERQGEMPCALRFPKREKPAAPPPRLIVEELEGPPLTSPLNFAIHQHEILGIFTLPETGSEIFADWLSGKKSFTSGCLRFIDASTETEFKKLRASQARKLGVYIYKDTIDRTASLHLFHNPTQHLPLESRFALHRTIHQLATEGHAILIVSPWLPELLGLCDRIAVLHDGKLSDVLSADSWNESSALQYARGGVPPA